MLDNILTFMPFITAILSGFVTYYFIIRRKKSDRFFAISEDSLKECYSPIYHELHLIMNSLEFDEQKALIDNFFKKYMSCSTPIYKISNSFILDWFYETEKAYSQFLNEWTADNWKMFWKKLLSFYGMLETCYRDTHFIVYKEIRSKEYLFKRNMYSGILIEILGSAYDFFAFISGILIISTLVYVCGILFHIPGCNQTGFIWLGAVLIISVTLWGLMMLLVSGYLVYRNPLRMTDNSMLSRIVEKIFHMDTWEEWLEKKYPDEIVPEMPTQMYAIKGKNK